MTAARRASSTALQSVFDGQVDHLIVKGYPELAGLKESAFRRRLAPLKKRLPELSTGGKGSGVAFIIVLRSELVPRGGTMPLVELAHKRGFTEMEPDDLERFEPPDGVDLPDGPAYLAADIDTGGGTLNVTPDDALESIAREKRSPLTIDEGVALITHYPEILRTENSFSMLASRCGDRRVTAMWISRGRPRLGWCWAGNSHTWLGSASCGSRH